MTMEFERILASEKARAITMVQAERHEEVLRKFRKPVGNTFVLVKKDWGSFRVIEFHSVTLQQVREYSDIFFSNLRSIRGPEDLLREAITLEVSKGVFALSSTPPTKPCSSETFNGTNRMRRFNGSRKRRRKCRSH